MKIAVIGAGISGNIVSRILATEHDVHIFEASSYLGGHTNTIDFELASKTYSADTGFMVFNEKTYPNFCQMLDMLQVNSQESDMSFSVKVDDVNLEYQGSGLSGLFAQKKNLVNFSFLKMLLDINKFFKVSREKAAKDDLETGITVGKFLDDLKLGSDFKQYFFIPMVAAIWSADPNTILDFPAKFLIGFFENHGLLQIFNRPQWRTITNGARSYVNKLMLPLSENVRLDTPVTSVKREDNQVIVESKDGIEFFDQVVFATHADQSLNLLADPTEDEQEILSCFPYKDNDAILHTDSSLMPNSKKAWASWNYHLPKDTPDVSTLTYDLSRLQNIDTPTPVFLTLNETSDIDPRKILRSIKYAHPEYSLESISAQKRHHELNGKNNTFFCGAYWGYGFHEDGLKSGLRVLEHFGLSLNDLSKPVKKQHADLLT